MDTFHTIGEDWVNLAIYAHYLSWQCNSEQTFFDCWSDAPEAALAAARRWGCSLLGCCCFCLDLGAKQACLALPKSFQKKSEAKLAPETGAQFRTRAKLKIFTRFLHLIRMDHARDHCTPPHTLRTALLRRQRCGLMLTLNLQGFFVGCSGASKMPFVELRGHGLEDGMPEMEGFSEACKGSKGRTEATWDSLHPQWGKSMGHSMLTSENVKEGKWTVYLGMRLRWGRRNKGKDGDIDNGIRRHFGAYEARDNGNWILIYASKRERSWKRFWVVWIRRRNWKWGRPREGLLTRF